MTQPMNHVPARSTGVNEVVIAIFTTAMIIAAGVLSLGQLGLALS